MRRNALRFSTLPSCPQALQIPATDPAVIETVDAFMRRGTGRELACCPQCWQTAMRLVEVLAPRRNKINSTGPP